MIKQQIDNHGVATVVMDREEVHNAFDEQLIRELTQNFQQLDKNEQVKIICLKGAGKNFSAGADLNWMKKMAAYSWDENYQDSLKLASLMSTIANCKKPTMALVQGASFGGGVGLVAACDFAICSNDAIFCLSEVRLGLIPSVISPYVVKAIGARAASRYFISAERFNANDALRLGLVSEICEKDNLDKVASKLLKLITANAPRAIIEVKKLIRRVEILPIDEDMIRETAQKIADQRASQEGKEGVCAFLEKREPQWPQESRNVTDLVDGDADV